jgi:hypothetical protein
LVLGGAATKLRLCNLGKGCSIRFIPSESPSTSK